MMNKTVWARPNAKVEEFAANEYVAACTGDNWALVCDGEAANTYEKSHVATGAWSGNYYDGYSIGYGPDSWVSGVQHGTGDGGCTKLGNYTVTLGDNDRPTGVVENGGTDYPCTFYTDQTYGTSVEISSLNANTTVYWTTANSDGRVWHHVGTLYGHENRS